MAFPAPVSITQSQAVTATTTVSITLPTVTSGQGILIVGSVRSLSVSGGKFTSLPSGWTELYDDGALSSGFAIYRKADGTESTPLVLTASTTLSQWCADVFLFDAADIADWDTQPPEHVITPITTATDPWTLGSTLTPTGGAKDYFWLASAHQHTRGLSLVSYPTSYTDNQTRHESSSGGSACVINYASRNYNGTSQSGLQFDWTSSTNATGAIALIAVHPPSGGGPTYTLACDSGSFSLSGQSAGLLANRILSAGQGSFSLTGNDAALHIAYLLSASSGSFSLSGQQISFLRSLRLSAEAGSFALSGQDAGLLRSLLLTAESGSIALSGQSASIILSRLIELSAGSFTATGNDALISAARRLDAAKGDFTITGQDAALTAAQPEYSLLCETGTYGIIGQDATLLIARATSLEAGTFALSGQSANLVKTIVAALQGGEFALTGQSAGLSVARVLVAGHGVFTLTGQTVLFSTQAAGSSQSSRLMVAFLAPPMQISIPGPQIVYLPASIEVEI